MSTAVLGRATSGHRPAFAVLIGSFVSLLGLSWDAQWHSDVGPDTFFTLPHLLLYSGSAIAGTASLAVVLAATAAARAGRPITAGGRPIGVLGTFQAPIGYLVAGCGAASFLLYGLWDLWWHTLYGFDAVLESPPHIGLLLSISITMIGAIITFSAALDQRWGLVGLVAATSLLLGFWCLIVVVLQALGDTVNWLAVGTGVIAALLLLMIRALVARTGVIVLTAAALGVLQVILWWVSPWATRVYADSVSLPLRDSILGVPVMAALMPMGLVLVASAAELVFRIDGRNRWRYPAIGALLAGGVAACAPYQDMIVYDGEPPTRVLPAVVVGVVAGALAGVIGHELGAMLRRTGIAR
ncbi:hypothetical protein [Kribbella sp. DT2]|uniref:hypothetical protein n=1 Tax=Kribbella sp. DT2 TaxID=3393427 RepID=UPI003CEE4D8B